MKHRINRLIFWVVVAISIVSCKAPDGAMGPSGTDIKGSLVGIAKLHNRLGVEEISDSIKVKADGSSPLIYAYTDSTGMFELKNLPTGTYDLVYEKKGYGYNKLMGVEFVGGSKKSYVLDAQPIHLIRYPLPNELNLFLAAAKAYSIKKSISGSYETITPSKIDYLRITFGGEADTSGFGYGSGIAIYTYKNDSVSRNKFDFVSYNYYGYRDEKKDISSIIHIPYINQKKVYIKAYTCITCEWTYNTAIYQDTSQYVTTRNLGSYQPNWNPNYNYSKYYDKDKNLWIATALGDSSNVISVKIKIP